MIFADAHKEPILAFHAEPDVGASQGGHPVPDVQHYEPFIMSVRDIDDVNQALARAQRHLAIPRRPQVVLFRSGTSHGVDPTMVRVRPERAG